MGVTTQWLPHGREGCDFAAADNFLLWV